MNHVGKRYGQLMVLSQRTGNTGHLHLKCRCDCGSVTEVWENSPMPQECVTCNRKRFGKILRAGDEQRAKVQRAKKSARQDFARTIPPLDHPLKPPGRS